MNFHIKESNINYMKNHNILAKTLKLDVDGVVKRKLKRKKNTSECIDMIIKLH